MNQSHGKEIRMKLMYKLKISDVAVVGKAEDYDVGFQEILPAEVADLDGAISALKV